MTSVELRAVRDATGIAARRCRAIDALGSPSAASVAACMPAETLHSLAILNSHEQLDGTAHCSRLPILEGQIAL